MRRQLKIAVLALAVSSALTVGACGSDPADTVSSSAPSSTAATSVPPTVERDDALAATVPEAIRSTGTLTVGINVPYEPNEFLDGSGKLVGFDVDLMDAIGTVLGLKPQFQRRTFAALLAGVPKGRYDLAISSITDTAQREKVMDFVTYFNAGVSWASRAGNVVDPDDACGKRVAVKRGTVAQRVDVAGRSKACVAGGRKAIIVVPAEDQDAAVETLVAGKADALAADSPIVAYEVDRSNGALVLAPGVFLSQPYGIAFEKNSPLIEPVRGALQSLMDSGAYQRIAEKWGVDNGTVPTAIINGAGE